MPSSQDSKLSSSEKLDSDIEGMEEAEAQEKETQAGRGVDVSEKCCKRKKCKVKNKKEVKKLETVKKEKKKTPRCSVVIDDDENCVKHSFCFVQSLKKEGVSPMVPKGFPWSSGRLLYLPGQRPKRFDASACRTKKDIAEMEEKKKKRLKKKRKKEKKIMQELRQSDHVRLCDVMDTTQELMILMNIFALVMERKKAENARQAAQIQTESEIGIPDEDGGEEEDDSKEGEEDDEEEEGEPLEDEEANPPDETE